MNYTTLPRQDMKFTSTINCIPYKKDREVIKVLKDIKNLSNINKLQTEALKHKLKQIGTYPLTKRHLKFLDEYLGLRFGFEISLKHPLYTFVSKAEYTQQYIKKEFIAPIHTTDFTEQWRYVSLNHFIQSFIHKHIRGKTIGLGLISIKITPTTSKYCNMLLYRIDYFTRSYIDVFNIVEKVTKINQTQYTFAWSLIRFLSDILSIATTVKPKTVSPIVIQVLSDLKNALTKKYPIVNL